MKKAKKERLISDTVFEILQAKNMPQKIFSLETGIPESTVSDWKGKRLNPSADRILKICEVLDVTPYELLNEETPGRDDEHIVAAKGSEEFDLIREFRTLDEDQKERLRGCITRIRNGED